MMFREGHKRPRGGIILGDLLKSKSGPETHNCSDWNVKRPRIATSTRG